MGDTVAASNISANDITQMIKITQNNVDKIYKKEALTSCLDLLNNVSQLGVGAHEVRIPKIETSGLKDYDKVSGYPRGYFRTTYETKTFNYDRGLKFGIDAMDLEEDIVNTFGAFNAEALRTRFIPELDAWHIARYVQKTTTGNRSVKSISTGADVLGELRKAINTMDDNEVELGGRVLFIATGLKGYIDDMDSNKSKAALSRFSQVIEVPSPRMYSDITLLGDGTSIASDGGYAKATGAVDVNFLVVTKAAALQYTKHVINKVFTPNENQIADQWTWCYRSYGLCDVYDNKVNGLYVSTKAAIPTS